MSDIRYRKISVQIWNDERVERLSDDAKLGFVFVLTHPLMTGIGAARLSVPGLSAERGWDAKKGAKAFGEAFREGLLEYDEKRCLLWAPNFLKHNKPESPNVVKSWQWIPVTLPDCPLKYKIFQSVKAFTEGLSEDFAKALPEVFREGYRESKNTEQRTESTEQRAQSTGEDMSADADRELCQSVLDDLNCVSGRAYSVTKAHAKLILARIKEGATFQDFQHVHRVKVAQWAKDPKMHIYIRPKTLYAADNFEGYRNQPEISSTLSDLSDAGQKTAVAAQEFINDYTRR